MIIESIFFDDLINIFNKKVKKMNLCPCLDCLTKYFKKQKKKVKNVQAQEENLMGFQETALTDTITEPKPITSAIHQQKQQISSYFEEQPSSSLDQDILDVKMELNPTTPEPVEPTRDIQDLIKEELGLAPAEVVAQPKVEKVAEEKKKEEESFELIFDDISQHTFTINLDPLDPFFPILHEKTAKIEDYFAKKGSKIDVPQPNRTNLDIQIIDNGRMSTFIMKYSLGCSFSFYLSLQKNERLQTAMSGIIRDVKVLQAFRPNLTKNTIKFKRLGGLEPRDCCYIKYNNSSKGQHWLVYIHDEQNVPSSTSKTCELFCIKNIREVASKELSINEYIQIDLQTNNVASILPKLASQYRTYLNNLQTHIQKNYEQESA